MQILPMKIIKQADVIHSLAHRSMCVYLYEETVEKVSYPEIFQNLFVFNEFF